MHIRHAQGFASAADARATGSGLGVDLGSGGGVPGLVLAAGLGGPRLVERWALVDSRRRSVDFLGEAISMLGLLGAVDVVQSRAEDLSRMPEWRETADLVVARGFSGPAITAECASGLLKPGGHLVVSEPPGSSGDRWDHHGLRQVAMRLCCVEQVGVGGFAVLEKVSELGDRYPRRAGLPQKRPLF